jgi:parvulin-like peptidyl-prolyl isomerase
MKKLIVGLMMTVFLATSAFATSEIIDKTLAVVNGEPVFASEFNSFFAPLFEQYKRSVPPSSQTPQKENELKDAILNRMIEDVLLKQEVKKQKIKVTKKELEDGIKEIKKIFTNEAEFAAELKKENITVAEFEKKLEEQIAVINLIKQSVEFKIKMPTEIETRAFYNKIVTKMKGGKTNLSHEDDLLVENLAAAIKRMSSEQVRLRQIFINCPKDVADVKLKAVQAKITAIKKELQRQTFANVAAQHSEDSVSRARNGDLGLITKDDIAPSISKIVFSMKVGEYTKEPIRTDTGYHFIKVEEKHAKKDMTFNNIKNDIEEVLYQNNTRQACTEYINNLKAKAGIKINKNW